MAGYNVSKRPNGRWRARYRGPDRKERSRHFARKVDAERWARTEAARLVTLDRYGHLYPGDVHLYVDRLGEVALAARADYLRTRGDRALPAGSDDEF